METLLLFGLELVRVFLILLIGLAILFGLENWVALLFQLQVKQEVIYLPFIANFLIVLVVYRNFLQFRGWYVSQKMKRLPQNVTYICLGISVILLMLTIAY